MIFLILVLNFALVAVDAQTQDIMETAITEAANDVNARRKQNQDDAAFNNYSEEHINDPVYIHSMFSASRESSSAIREFGMAGDIMIAATGKYYRRTGVYPDVKEFSRKMSKYCPKRNVTCQPSSPFRTADGSCNNLKNPLWGASVTTQQRFLPPSYGDYLNLGTTPRTKGVKGLLLPNPRVISNTVHRGGFSPPRSNVFNVALTTFGQFIDHDVISTPTVRDGDQPIRCCTGDRPINRPECFPFPTPPGEFRTTCMSFVRSDVSVEPGCPPGPRNQINQRTSFLDLFVTYGNTEDGQNSLRERWSGRLKEGVGRILPDAPEDTPCSMSTRCFLTGDDRTSENPMLTVVHIIFLREHNNIVEELKVVNPGWNSERLFQEAKKIVTGIYQHIIYTEFLPIIIGHQGMEMFGLRSRSLGYLTSYNPKINPSTRNSFGAAAYRFGHSLIGSFVAAYDPKFTPKAVDVLENQFFKPETIRNKSSFGTDGIGRWMTSQLSSRADRFLTTAVRERLFQTMPGNGFDLSALNIQRGRDHGIPSYNRWRQFCGLRPAMHFGTGPFGLSSHEPPVADALKSVYRHPEDIDLFAGALSERPAPGALVGPTFRCIIGLQFKMYKTGDRFFYENNFKLTGFTPAQLMQIKRQTLSALYCRTIRVGSMPANAFVSDKAGTPRIPCQFHHKLDLRPWHEFHYKRR